MEFKVGSIIRKINHEGTQYGAYLMVESANKSSVSAYYINPSENDLVLIPRKFVTVCSIVTLTVPHDDIMKISDNNLLSYVHSATKLWSATADKNPDLICIRDVSSSKRIIFSNCLFKRVMVHRTIKEAKTHFERDIVKHIPSIRIFFGSKIYEEE